MNTLIVNSRIVIYTLSSSDVALEALKICITVIITIIIIIVTFKVKWGSGELSW